MERKSSVPLLLPVSLCLRPAWHIPLPLAVSLGIPHQSTTRHNVNGAVPSEARFIKPPYKSAISLCSDQGLPADKGLWGGSRGSPGKSSRPALQVQVQRQAAPREGEEARGPGRAIHIPGHLQPPALLERLAKKWMSRRLLSQAPSGWVKALQPPAGSDQGASRLALGSPLWMCPESPENSPAHFIRKADQGSDSRGGGSFLH